MGKTKKINDIMCLNILDIYSYYVLLSSYNVVLKNGIRYKKSSLTKRDFAAEDFYCFDLRVKRDSKQCQIKNIMS